MFNSGSCTIAISQSLPFTDRVDWSRALVNRYLHWHHSNSRLASTTVFRPTLLAVLRGIPGDATAGKESVARVLGILDAGLAKTQYIVGDSLTLAGACVVRALFPSMTQLTMTTMVSQTWRRTASSTSSRSSS